MTARVRIWHRQAVTTHVVEGWPSIISVHEFSVWLVENADRHNRRGNRTLLGWGSDEDRAYALELAIRDWRHHRQNRRAP